MSEPIEKDNQLVGRCPICSVPEASDWHNDAYNASTIDSSDEDAYLVWSEYYQLHVCRVCRVEGINLTIDKIRDNEDAQREYERQKMGFTQTYVTNTLLSS